MEMTDEDILAKLLEELHNETIKTAYIAHLHTTLKDNIKTIKEQIKERKTKIEKKTKEIVQS